jgi:diguanylate cyclase (GGDEF)-like protein
LNRRAWFASAELAPPSAVALFDIDFFKSVNDEHGHPAGDHVLREVAWRLQAVLGTGGTVGRVGGEEFGVFLRQPWEECERLAQQALEAISVFPIVLDSGVELEISASAGMAPLLQPVGDRSAVEQSYEAADRLLYVAKRAGRHRLVARRTRAA